MKHIGIEEAILSGRMLRGLACIGMIAGFIGGVVAIICGAYVVKKGRKVGYVGVVLGIVGIVPLLVALLVRPEVFQYLQPEP